MNCVVSPGHMRVILVLLLSMLLLEYKHLVQAVRAYLICKEHQAKILVVFLAYKAVMQDGGLVSG